MNCWPVPIDERAFRELDRASRWERHDWVQVCDWLAEGSAQVWNVNDEAFVLTLANNDNEIEVLMCGGKNARANVPVWEAAMLSCPAHKGCTLRLEGRKGWRRYLPHWDYRDGVLTRKI